MVITGQKMPGKFGLVAQCSANQSAKKEMPDGP
jgi:hypothetical protein